MYIKTQNEVSVTDELTVEENGVNVAICKNSPMPIRDKDMEKNETHLADTNLNIERLSEYSSDSDSGQNSPPATAGGFTVDDDEIPAGFMLDDEKFNRFEPKYISIRI